MPLPPLTKETLELLDAISPPHGKTTTAHTDSVYEAIEPIHGMLEGIRDTLANIDRLRRAADRTEEGDYAYAFFERIKQTVDAASRQSRDTLAHLDQLTDTLFQMDRYGIEMRASLETHLDRAATHADAAARRVVISRSEYEKLQGEAAVGREAQADKAKGKT